MAAVALLLSLTTTSALAQALPTSAVAQYYLGIDYYLGRNGKTKNAEEAVKWFRKAAEQGNENATQILTLIEGQKDK